MHVGKGTLFRKDFWPSRGAEGTAGPAGPASPPSSTCRFSSHLVFSSCRTRASCGRPPRRRPPSSWTPPLPRAGATSRTATRTTTATPTCSSPCTSTSTGWRRAGKGEVSALPLPSCLLVRSPSLGVAVVNGRQCPQSGVR